MLSEIHNVIGTSHSINVTKVTFLPLWTIYSDICTLIGTSHSVNVTKATFLPLWTIVHVMVYLVTIIVMHL